MIQLNSRIRLHAVTGIITAIEDSRFCIKFDEYAEDGESDLWYPNTLLPMMVELDVAVIKIKKSKKVTCPISTT